MTTPFPAPRFPVLTIFAALIAALTACSAPSDQAPEIVNPGDQQTRVGQSVDLPLKASDPEGEPVTFSARGLPEGLKINPAKAVISGIPIAAEDAQVTLKAIDNHNNATQVHFHWLVTPNHPPKLDPPTPRQTRVNSELRIELAASDSDGDALTFQAESLPEGLSLDPKTGVVSGKASKTGDFEIPVTVSDGFNKITAKLSLTVTPNHPPEINNPGQLIVSVGEQVNLTIQASDADGDSLTFHGEDLPEGLTIDPSTGVVTGQPTTEAALWQSTITVTDSFGDSSESTVNWEVKAFGLAGLVGRWRFEEGSGQIAHDSSGNSNDGTFHDNNGNPVDGGWGAGDFAGTLAMDGGDDGIVVIPMSDSIRAIKDKVTVMAWTYRTDRHNVAVMAHDYSNSLFFGYHEFKDESTDPPTLIRPVFKWDIHNDKGDNAACWTPTPALKNQPTDHWYHLTGVYDGQNAILYVDGQEICRDALTGNLLIADKPITLSGFLNGGSGPALTDEITGNLDDVRLYDRALSPEEIRTIYSQTKKN